MLLFFFFSLSLFSSCCAYIMLIEFVSFVYQFSAWVHCQRCTTFFAWALRNTVSYILTALSLNCWKILCFIYTASLWLSISLTHPSPLSFSRFLSLFLVFSLILSRTSPSRSSFLPAFVSLPISTSNGLLVHLLPVFYSAYLFYGASALIRLRRQKVVDWNRKYISHHIGSVSDLYMPLNI